MLTIRRVTFFAAFVVFALCFGAALPDVEASLPHGFASAFAFFLICYDAHVASLRKDMRDLISAEARASAAFRTIKKAIGAYEDGGA